MMRSEFGFKDKIPRKFLGPGVLVVLTLLVVLEVSIA